ncbi:uncharacterized protein V6R79_020576 [Siganus canaliculatus]
MSEVQTFRVFVRQRLTAAAEDIFEQFERTIAKYEEQLSRQQKLLDAVFQPQVRLNRTDEEQMVVTEAEWSPGLEQDEPPELPQVQVKEEQKEVGTSPEGDQFEGLDEPDLIQLVSTPVPVKSEEDDKEEAQYFQHHNNQTKDVSDGDDLQTEAGGSEAAKNLSEKNHLQTEIHVYKSDSSRAQNENSSDAEETSEPESGLNPLQNLEGSVSEVGCPSGAADAPDSGHKQHVQAPNRILRVGFRFSCSVCGKTFSRRQHLTSHMRCHSEKQFSCPICNKLFRWPNYLKRHMVCHSEEKPFSCSICNKAFKLRSQLKVHMFSHSRKKPFSCSICKKTFAVKRYVTSHMFSHMEEKPFSCSICKKSFSLKWYLNRHMICHFGEKPFRL